MSTTFTTPAPLTPGANVAVVAPASGLAAAYPHVYERGIRRLRETFEVEPVEFPTATRNDDYLYDHPAERARDIEAAFQDPEIRGVIATTGGNDQIRILKHLDGDLLRDHPTRFYGSSDNTHLAQFLWRHGIISFYGGTLLTDLAVPGPLPAYLESALRQAFFDSPPDEIHPAPAFTDQDLDWADETTLTTRPEMEDNDGWLWRGGDVSVTGRTWGGGLASTHQQVTATRYLPAPAALEDTVLLLETSERLPSPGVVQERLLGLGERGILSRCAAFLIGRVKARSHTTERTQAERTQYRQQLRSTFVDVLTEYNETAPIVCNVDFGHTHPTVPVPIGATATVDPQAKRISFEYD